MAIIRWAPGRDMFGIQDEMNRLFDNFLGMPPRRDEPRMARWAPRVNIEEMEDKFEVTAEIPGIGKDEIKIAVKDHELTITGEKKVENKKNGNNIHLCERCYGQFVRTFTLPDNVDANKIAAGYENGILTLEIPKTKEAKPKEIEVKIK